MARETAVWAGVMESVTVPTRDNPAGLRETGRDTLNTIVAMASPSLLTGFEAGVGEAWVVLGRDYPPPNPSPSLFHIPLPSVLP